MVCPTSLQDADTRKTLIRKGQFLTIVKAYIGRRWLVIGGRNLVVIYTDYEALRPIFATGQTEKFSWYLWSFLHGVRARPSWASGLPAGDQLLTVLAVRRHCQVVFPHLKQMDLDRDVHKNSGYSSLNKWTTPTTPHPRTRYRCWWWNIFVTLWVSRLPCYHTSPWAMGTNNYLA